MKGMLTPTAVVLVNLGTPKELSVASVREFLREFLSDRRVVEIPRPIWLAILNLFILPLRPRKVVETYAEVWTDQGSPLRVITEAQVLALQALLKSRYGESAPIVVHAMTYGEPSIQSVIDKLYADGCRRVLVLPMYPQYSGSTTGAVYDQIARYVLKRRALPGLDIINSYFFEPAYIDALASSIRNFWAEQGRGDHLLFSYHGIPASYEAKGDPYPGHCRCTTAATADALGLDDSLYDMSFQSRFGKAEWVKPYTAQRVAELARQGVKRLDVVCPAFAADCIETLEEIAMENAEIFREAGGEELRLIPCLNTSPEHIDALHKILEPHLLALSPALRNL